MIVLTTINPLLLLVCNDEGSLSYIDVMEHIQVLLVLGKKIDTIYENKM